METRANHLAVGAFVLLAAAGLFAFVLWLGKTEIDREFDRYHIYFTVSVSGLTPSSTVRYRGVPVGTVSDIRIDPDNSERVRVTIEVARDTPIKEDAVASLEFQGLTGLVNVEISGGSRASPSLLPEEGQEIAVIASTPSKIEALFESVPQTLARLSQLIERGTLLLSDRNMAAIGETLENVRNLSGALAARSGDIEALTGDVAGAVWELRRTAESINGLVGDLRTRLPVLADDASSTLNAAEGMLVGIGGNAAELTEETQLTLRQFHASAQALNGAAEELKTMISENRQAFRDFSSEGLYELSRFLVEARTLVASLTRLANRLEADPARFLFGDSQAGFEPK